jgi:hypothetical protein
MSEEIKPTMRELLEVFMRRDRDSTTAFNEAFEWRTPGIEDRLAFVSNRLFETSSTLAAVMQFLAEDNPTPPAADAGKDK